MTHNHPPQRQKPSGHAVADANRMTLTGFCAFPSQGSHGFCHEGPFARTGKCTCPCHTASEAPSSAGFGEAHFGPHAAPPEPETGESKIEGLDDELLSHILYGDGQISPVVVDSIAHVEKLVKGRMTVSHPAEQQRRRPTS